MIIAPSTPSGYTIFCEDIRHEDNGKAIFIGVYNGDIVLPSDSEFPATLRSLAFHISYMERPDESTDLVEFLIYLPGQHNEPARRIPIFSGPRPPVSTDMVSDRPESEGRDPILSLRVNVVVSPIELQQTGEIRVRAQVGDDVVKLGSLQVRLADPTDNPELVH